MVKWFNGSHDLGKSKQHNSTFTKHFYLKLSLYVNEFCMSTSCWIIYSFVNERKNGMRLVCSILLFILYNRYHNSELHFG